VSIYKLLIQITGQDAGASAALRGVKGQVSGLEKSMKDLKALVGAGTLLYLGRQAADIVWDLANLGAESLQLTDSFEELARQAGGSADDILAAIKRASGGTVAEMDMILAANKGMMLGLGAQAEQWEQLTEVARFRARAMGRTVTEALDDITTGIGRESRMILDNLGIILDMDAITADYAQTLGKTAEQLSATERKQAILNSVIQEGQAQIQAAGGIADNAADQFQRLEAAVTDLKVAFAELVADPAADIAGFLAHELDQLPGVLILLEQFKEGVLSVSEFGEAAAARGIIMNKLGTEAALEYAEAVAEQGRAIPAEEFEYFYRLNSHLANKQKEAADAADEHTAALRTEWAATNDVTVAMTRLAGTLAVVASKQAGFELADQLAMWEENADPLASVFQDAQEEIRELQQVQEDLADSTRLSLGRASDSWDDYQSSIRSAVEAALTPTSVTALDMGLTDIGEYVDKWDEDARRLDAIAARGFAELDAHPDWAGILQIPDNVLRAGEDALKSWAQQTADDVRNLYRPDLLVDNLDAAVRAVEDYLQKQAARETSIEMITRAAIEKGVTPEDARAMVADMFGDTELVGETMATDVVGGMMVALEGTSVVGEFGLYLETDANKNKGVLVDAGMLVWGMVELGMKEAMYSTNWPKEIAALVSPYVVKQLEEAGYFE